MKKIISIVFFVSCFFSAASAQVTIAPTNMFIDSNSRFGTYMVINGSNQTQEVSIDFFFGYSKTDNDGNRSLVTEDSILAATHSIAEYIRAFPQNFTLNPGQKQVVRLRISAPNTIPDGTYWGRIKTTSAPETPPLELQSGDVVSAQIGISVEQVTGVFYKKGNVSTGIEITDIRNQLSEEDGKKLIILADYLRTGNSPFLGSITTQLINSQGNVVKTGFISTSLYFDGVHKQELEIDDLPPGSYTVNVSFESSRNDLSNNDLVQMPKSSETRTITIR